METLTSSPIEWGVASRSLPGQPTSGDRSIVKAFYDGVLMAAVDGIGHGEEAATAAAVAAATLEAHRQSADVAGAALSRSTSRHARSRYERRVL